MIFLLKERLKAKTLVHQLPPLVGATLLPRETYIISLATLLLDLSLCIPYICEPEDNIRNCVGSIYTKMVPCFMHR